MPIQYTQKQRKPCQGPKSPRLQTYRPPAQPGYFTTRAPTATASGKAKSSAAASHNMTEPGPACAAAGIQRVPTMQAMAKSVTSRSPISRLRPVEDSTARDIVPVYSGAAYVVGD